MYLSNSDFPALKCWAILKSPSGAPTQQAAATEWQLHPTPLPRNNSLASSSPPLNNNFASPSSRNPAGTSVSRQEKLIFPAARRRSHHQGDTTMATDALYPPAPANVPAAVTQVENAHRLRVVAMIGGLFLFLLIYLLFVAVAGMLAYWLLVMPLPNLRGKGMAAFLIF